MPAAAAGELVRSAGNVCATDGPRLPKKRDTISIGGIARRNPAASENMPEFINVDPAELFLPPSRRDGVDPAKLTRQISKHGNSLEGMPPLELVRGKDRHLRINDGVTRATRAAMLRPGAVVLAEVIQDLPRLDVTRCPQVKDRLP